MEVTGVTLAELARRTELPAAELAERLAEPGSLRLTDLGRIAVALNCGVFDLLSCSGDRVPRACCRRGAAA
ncbi:helix-turn-helix domain-containing protein [Nocardia sp. NPDC003482]